MPTEYTEHLLIIVRAALRDQADAMAVVADPEGGADTFTVPLRAASDNSSSPAVVGYWCLWTMTAVQRERLFAEYGQRMKKTLQAIPVGGNPRQQDDFWVFDAAWDPEAALAAVGMARMPTGGR